jgi:hypothetical protein
MHRQYFLRLLCRDVHFSVHVKSCFLVVCVNCAVVDVVAYISLLVYLAKCAYVLQVAYVSVPTRPVLCPGVLFPISPSTYLFMMTTFVYRAWNTFKHIGSVFI